MTATRFDALIAAREFKAAGIDGPHAEAIAGCDAPGRHRRP